MAVAGFFTRVTRQVTLVEQELHTLPTHLISHLVFLDSCCSICSFVCSFCSCRPLFLFVLFLLVIVLSLLRYMASDCSFVIFIHFSILLDKLSVMSVNIVMWGSLYSGHSSSCDNFYYSLSIIIP
jgi:hypothetical protein